MGADLTGAQGAGPDTVAGGQLTDRQDRTLGQRIKRFRELATLSQADLGGKLGVSYQQIQKYERGVNRVSVDTLVRMGRVLGQPVVAFLDPGEPAARGAAVSEAKPDYSTLSKEERELVKAWREIADGKVRAACMAMLKSASRKGKA